MSGACSVYFTMDQFCWLQLSTRDNLPHFWLQLFMRVCLQGSDIFANLTWATCRCEMFKVGPQEENNAVLEDTALWNRKRRHDTAQGPIIPDSRRLEGSKGQSRLLFFATLHSHRIFPAKATYFLCADIHSGIYRMPPLRKANTWMTIIFQRTPDWMSFKRSSLH